MVNIIEIIFVYGGILGIIALDVYLLLKQEASVRFAIIVTFIIISSGFYTNLGIHLANSFALALSVILMFLMEYSRLTISVKALEDFKDSADYMETKEGETLTEEISRFTTFKYYK